VGLAHLCDDVDRHGHQPGVARRGRRAAVDRPDYGRSGGRAPPGRHDPRRGPRAQCVARRQVWHPVPRPRPLLVWLCGVAVCHAHQRRGGYHVALVPALAGRARPIRRGRARLRRGLHRVGSDRRVPNARPAAAAPRLHLAARARRPPGRRSLPLAGVRDRADAAPRLHRHRSVGRLALLVWRCDASGRPRRGGGAHERRCAAAAAGVARGDQLVGGHMVDARAQRGRPLALRAIAARSDRRAGDRAAAAVWADRPAGAVGGGGVVLRLRRGPLADPAVLRTMAARGGARGRRGARVLDPGRQRDRQPSLADERPSQRCATTSRRAATRVSASRSPRARGGSSRRSSASSSPSSTATPSSPAPSPAYSSPTSG